MKGTMVMKVGDINLIIDQQVRVLEHIEALYGADCDLAQQRRVAINALLQAKVELDKLSGQVTEPLKLAD